MPTAATNTDESVNDEASIETDSMSSSANRTKYVSYTAFSKTQNHLLLAASSLTGQTWNGSVTLYNLEPLPYLANQNRTEQTISSNGSVIGSSSKSYAQATCSSASPSSSSQKSKGASSKFALQNQDGNALFPLDDNCMTTFQVDIPSSIADVALWEVQTGSSENCQFIAVACHDTTLRLFKKPSNVSTVFEHDRVLKKILKVGAASPDCENRAPNRIGTLDQCGLITMWDVEYEAELFCCELAQSRRNPATHTHSNAKLLTASPPSTSSCAYSYDAALHPITGRLVSASQGCVEVWSADAFSSGFSCITSFLEESHPQQLQQQYHSAKFCPQPIHDVSTASAVDWLNENQFAVASSANQNGCIRVYDVRHLEKPIAQSAFAIKPAASIVQMSADSSGKFISVVSDDPAVHLFAFGGGEKEVGEAAGELRDGCSSGDENDAIMVGLRHIYCDTAQHSDIPTKVFVEVCARNHAEGEDDANQMSTLSQIVDVWTCGLDQRMLRHRINTLSNATQPENQDEKNEKAAKVCDAISRHKIWYF